MEAELQRTWQVNGPSARRLALKVSPNAPLASSPLRREIWLNGYGRGSSI